MVLGIVQGTYTRRRNLGDHLMKSPTHTPGSCLMTALYQEDELLQADNLIGFCIFISLCVCLVAQSCPTLCNPMDCSPPAPLSMECSRQEYWSGLPFHTPGYLPNPGIEPRSPAPPALQVDSLPAELWGKPFSFCKQR